MISRQSGSRLGPSELEKLREKINSEAYLHEAIHRIALVMSNELLDINNEQGQGGWVHERKRRK